MGKNILVTPEVLETTAGTIEGLATDYKTQYDALYEATNGMAAAWSGADNLAFTEQIAGFKDDFEKMHGLMQAYALFLRRSAKAYRTTQETVISEARSLIN